MSNEVELPADAPRPRLCHIVKREDFNGYGFNLHAQKARPGQFIGVVDKGSPAEDAGLREGDRIIEVNGVNIALENHRQVVERIKAIPNETSLLVVDKATEDYYKKRDIIIRKSLPNVLRQSSIQHHQHQQDVDVHNNNNNNQISEPETVRPEVHPSLPEVTHKVAKFELNDEDDDDEEDGVDRRDQDDSQRRRSSSKSSSSSVGKKQLSLGSETGSSLRSTPSPQPRISTLATPQPITRGSSSPDGATSSGSIGSGDDDPDKLNLDMTAAEMRRLIGLRKKKDPRKDKSLDIRKKYEIIQTL